MGVFKPFMGGSPPLQLVTGGGLARSFPFAVEHFDGSPADTRALMAIQEAGDWLAHDRPDLRSVDEVSIREGATGTKLARALEVDGRVLMQVGTSETRALVDGIERLRNTPWAQWSQEERHSFVGANITVLHEHGHIQRLPGVRPGGWGIEEAAAELQARAAVREWMRNEYEVELTAADLVLPKELDAYPQLPVRLGALLHVAGFEDAVAGARALLHDGPMDDAYDRIAAGLPSPFHRIGSDAIEDYLDTGRFARRVRLTELVRAQEDEARRRIQ